MFDHRSTVVVLLISLASQNLIMAVINDTPAAMVSDGCAKKSLGDTLYNKNPLIPKKTWLQTPSVVELANDYYQAFGRVVHLKYLKEQLKGQPTFLNFDAIRGELDFKIRLDILADTIYIEGKVALHGIKQLNLFARQIIASRGSQLDVSTPSWNQEYERRVVSGVDGIDGKHGFDGPRVELYADVIHGSFDVNTSGANGQKGQDGGDGRRARNSGATASDIPESRCHALPALKCDKAPIPGVVGEKGPQGGQGGNAGHPGNGGNAGHIVVRYQRLEGKVELESCRGTGAEPAKNGKGGLGGAGGKGGRGRQCYVPSLDHPFCASHSLVGRASSGPPGEPGNPGTTPNTPGTDGTVDRAAIRTGALDLSSKQKYPVRLLRAIFRRAEDFLLADSNDESGKAALNFIITVTRGQRGLRSLRRAAKKKLVFVGKKGYDIFGRNELFAPRLKWDALKDYAEKIKEAAKTVEKAYNDIKSTVEKNENFAEVARKLSKTAELQVEAEKKRLEEARLIARSEKRLYVKSIEGLEEQMTSILKLVKEMLPSVYKKAKFNANDMLAVLQGITGFVSGAISKDPGAFLGAAVGIASDLSGKACLGSFNWNLEAIKRSLTFGEKYKPLKQSSDLNFDDFDVSAVPEVMQNNLDMNKEKLAAQLVCMLDVASRPQDVAELKQHIESFFSSGSARIDLIAKVLDLDNDIGGYNFDIPILIDTKTTIAKVGADKGGSISRRLQLNFMENLLSTYERIERSFMMNVYELHKAFNFRTLWEGNDPLADFRRVASESAAGTGRLNGMLQLSNVLTKVEDLERKAVQCFTTNRYSTGIRKWVFSKAQNKAMFESLSKGYTKFSINIDQSCDSCYNVRLLKLYVELTGPSQPTNVPSTVHLKIRHLSGSYFRAGDKKIKEYRQALEPYRNIKFDRLAISDATKCEQQKVGGNRQSSFCVNEGDTRLQPMCSSPLNGGKSRDRLLGEEECKSPFGSYELMIPVDKKLSCTATGIQTKNCKDLDLTKFTAMNVWASYYLWSGKAYPKGPDDPICKSPRERKSTE